MKGKTLKPKKLEPVDFTKDDEVSASRSNDVVMLPCPFCGEAPTHRERTDSDVHYGEFWPAMVQCRPCRILFRGEDAVKRWNNRAT